MAESQFDSGDFAHSRFPLHGHTTTAVEGRVFRVLAQGPFNLELVQAHVRAMLMAARQLPPDRGFIELFHCRGSVLMPREAWQLVTDFVDQAGEVGFRAKATIIVLGPEVEGHELFSKRLEQIWSRTRPVYRVLTLEEGEATLKRLLAEQGWLDPSS